MANIMALKEKIRSDGWANILTGLGFRGKDKRMSAEAQYNLFNEIEAEDLYASDEMAAKINDLLPLDMLREGFRLVSPDVDDDVLEQAMDYFEKLVMTNDGSKLGEAMIWGRMYGGAALVLGIGMDDDTKEPLDINRIPTIEHMTLLNRWELIAQGINGDPTSNNFGMPETYMIQPRVTGTVQGSKGSEKFAHGTLEIHHSRLVRFDGARLPRQKFIQNHYWHDSVLNRAKDAIRDYQNAFASASALILDFAQAVYKVKNLADIVSAPDGLKTIQDRIGIIEMSRSVLRAAIVDADGEDFERKTTSLAGLDRTLDKLSRKFTASTEYPHTILLGEGAGNGSGGGGLGNNGSSEKSDYYELVRRKQKQELKPRLMHIFKIIFAAGDGPTQGKVPTKFDIEFEPLKHLSQGEMIEARKMQAESDKIYMETGAVDPTEIAMSRFGAGEYSFETEIDETLREAFDVVLEDPNDTERLQAEKGGTQREMVESQTRGDRAPRKKAHRSRKFNGKRYR